MAGVNRYFRFSKISEAQFRFLLRCFALDLTVTQTAAMTGISVRSVNDIFLCLRRRLASECQKHSPFAGELEADESYFGPHRVCGRKGRGALGKTIVFGLLKRDDQVYTEIVPNASKAALQAVIRNKASLASVLHTDKWRGYDGLVDLGYERHHRVSAELNGKELTRSWITHAEIQELLRNKLALLMSRLSPAPASLFLVWRSTRRSPSYMASRTLRTIALCLGCRNWVFRPCKSPTAQRV